MFLNIFFNNIKKYKHRKMDKFISLLSFNFLKQNILLSSSVIILTLFLFYLLFSAVIFINIIIFVMMLSLHFICTSLVFPLFLFSLANESGKNFLTYLSFSLVSILHLSASIIDFTFTFISLFSLDFYHINSVSSLFIVEYKIHMNPLFSSFDS